MPIPTNGIPGYRPYSNIQPFTVRDGATYALQIETLISWIRNTLVPSLDTETGELAENWKELSQALIVRVDAAEASIGNAVTEADAAKSAAEAARDLAEIFASQAEAVQDIAITQIFNNTSSQFRQAIASTLIVEDAEDPGTFVIHAPSPMYAMNIEPDPSDPGFFIEKD